MKKRNDITVIVFQADWKMKVINTTNLKL